MTLKIDTNNLKKKLKNKDLQIIETRFETLSIPKEKPNKEIVKLK